MAQNSKVGVSRFLDTFFFDIKKWQRSWSNIEDPVVLFERNFVRTPTCCLVMGKTVRGSSNGTWMGKSPELGMSVCSSKTRTVLFCIRG